MPPLVPSTLLVSLLLAGPALLLTPPTSQELGVRVQRLPRDTNQNSIKVVISESCVSQGDSSNSQQGGKELDLVPGSPLVLTHRIQLIPPASGSGSCGCEADFAALRERLERLEREVSDLREKCGGTDGGCCSSKESKGAGCSIKPGIDECPNECSDQGRCVDGKCVCFPGFSGPDCSQSNCPGNCNDKGRCVNGQCVCDPGFTGPDCSQSACPDNCSNRGRCVDGKCVCDSGFSGPTCSDKACPGNCNNRGRCVNGQCVCKSGFTGPDCSERACPGNCNNRGRCVNGKCVCDSGSSGADCSEDSCPGNCNNKGRCVNGQCVCNPGFTGPDCSEKTCPDNCSDRGRCVNGKCVCDSGFEGPNCADKACPGNCNNRGRCVNGKCVCDVGFTGADCAAKACPNNCSNKGRCVKGRCVCRRGFTGPDCSECEAGMTGPNCDIEMAGVSQLETRDLTETSVTLFWTPPPVQYNTYHLVITSEKESDQQISVQVEGSRTSYTQTGLAAGQEYSATLTGEIDGRMGEASSSDFMTLISSPRNLQVVKTTTTSAVVQWEQSQGEIDRYRLTVSPNDGIGSGPEMTLPPERTSAQIEQLEAGRLYDIMLVAEKGRMISEPATTQATPGKMWSLVTTATVSTQVTLAPGRDINGKGQAPDKTAPDQKGRSEDASGRDYVNVRGAVPEPKGAAANVTARKTVFTRRDGAKRPIGPGVFRLNGTRLGPGGRKFGPGPPKKPPVRKPLVGIEEKTPLDTESRKPGLPATGDEALALTVKQSSIKTSSTEKEDNENPTKITPAGINSGTDVQSSSSEPTVSHDSKEQSAEVGMKTSESATGTEAEGVVHPESSEHNGTAHTNGKCLNKIKVTHFNLPLKDRVSGGRADGVSTESSPTQPSSSEIDETDLNIPGKEHGKESSSGVETTERDPLRQLLADTFDGLKIKTFSVHLSQPSGLDLDADRMRQQIIKGLAPVSSPAAASFSSSSSSSRTSLLPLLLSPNSLSSSSSSSSTSSPPPPPSSTPLSSSPSSALTSLSPTPSSLLTSPSSSSSSSSHASDISDTENKPKVAKITNDEGITGGGSLETRRNQTHILREGGVPPFRRPPPAKGGYPYRQHPNVTPFQNRTQTNLRPPPRRFQPKNAERKDTDHVHVSSSEFPPSSSKESSTVDDTRTDRSGETRTVSLGLGRNQTKPWRGLVRRPPPNGGYPHRLQPHLRQFQNRTHPNSRTPHRTLKPEIPETETSLEESFSVIDSENLARTNSESEGVTPVMSIGAKRNQTTTLTAGVPPIHNPSPKVRSQRKPHPNIVSVQNRTRPNFNPPSPPHHPSSPFNPVIETEKEDVSSSEIPFLLSSSFSSKQSHPVEGTEKDGHTSRDRERTTTVVSIGPKHNQTVRGNGKPPFYRQPPDGAHPKQTHPYMARFQNRTRQILRPPHHPQKGLLRKPPPPRKINGDDGITHGIQTTGIQTNQSEAHGVHTPTHTAQTVQSGEQDTTVVIQTNRLGGDAGTTSQTGGADASHGIQITQPGESETKMNVLGEEGTIHRDSITHTGSDRDTGSEDASVNRHTASTATAPPTTKVSPDTMNHRALETASPLKKTILLGRKRTQGHTQMRNNTAMSQEGQDSKTAHPGSPKGQVSEIKDLRSGGSSELHGSEDSLTEDTVGEPLDYVGVRNVGSDGFTVVWDAPEGKYTNFIVTTKEPDVKGDQPKWEEKQGQEEESDSEEDSGERGNEEDAGRGKAGNNGLREENAILVNDKRPTAGVHGSTTAEPSTGSDKNVTKVVPGTARSCQFENLPPQTPFTVTLLGKGPGLFSKLHKLVISTGPEPPSNLVFSEVTENSLTLSWTKPKNHVDAFKVTYMHTEEGEPVSVSVDSGDSTLDLSQLSPGSSYEISVISVLGLDESDPIKDLTMTLPDPPTDLKAINITDSKALLLWRPALARVDKYSIVYGSGKGSDIRVTVSGNAAEQPLKGLEGSTTYTVTITSQLGSLESSPASTAFTTTGGSGRDGPRELQASQVTPRTALLSWKPPPTAVGSYRLTYQTEGQEMKEVTVDSTVTEYKLVKLHPGAKYTASLQAESRGTYTGAISTEFTTGTLRYPFPTDCSQELLNGIRESGEAEIFLMGRPGPSLMVYCDMETDGGGWTVIQRRKDGSVDFFRGWKEYSRGFGDLTGEFWLGLDNLHNITTAIKMGLRVDLREGGEAVFAKYTNFQVAKKNFKLTVAGYSGTAGDSMTYHNGRLFSTKDRDPSPFITRCAMSYRGGWWYKNCHEANLNGVYGNDVNHQGIIWTSWKGKQHSIPFAEMKMRPAAFHPPPAQG